MKNFYKHIFLFGFLLLLLMSVSTAVDEEAQVDVDNQVSIEETNIEYEDVVEQATTEKISFDEDTSKNIKSDEEDVSVEYVNITQSNYKKYFTVMGDQMFIGRSIISSNNSLVLNMQYFPGNINYLGLDETNAKFANRTLTITSDRNIALTNVAVVLSSNFKTLTLENFNVTYNNEYISSEFFTISDNVQHCILRNVSIDMNIDGFAAGYLVEVNGPTLIENSYIKGRFMETTIEWLEGPKTPDAYGIRICSRNCILRNNTIDISSSGHFKGDGYYSLYGIYVMRHNTTFESNNIFLHNCTGYAYGIVLRSSNNTLSGNKISVSSVTYANGVILEMVMFQNNTIQNNYVNVTASYGSAPWGNAAVAYGLLMLDFNYNGGSYTGSGRHPTNNSFVNNTIVGSAGQIYGIEIYGTGNTVLSGNNINITGRTPMGIGVIGSNITIANNNIINNGTHSLHEPTADYIEAINTGIFTSYSPNNMYMINNSITSISGRGILIRTPNVIIKENNVNVTGYDYAVEITGIENNIIENNTLITTKHTGNKAVSAPTNNIVQNNIPEEPVIISLKINTTNFTTCTNNTLKANICYDDDIATNISKGKVSFKANGKILKDSNGKVIYAKVKNGTATIENYVIPDTWDENTTIQAVYSGSTDVSKLTSDKTSITIIQSAVNDTGVTFTTEDINTTTDSTIVLKATITEGNKLINTGKVVFKVNGKTVKDANGKVIYVKVINNTVRMEYKLPESYTAGSYSLTAVFIRSGSDKLVDTKTLIIA